jgi:hypothetical protein
MYIYIIYSHTHIYIYCTYLPNLQIRKTGRYSLDVIPISFAAVLDTFECVRMCRGLSWLAWQERQQSRTPQCFAPQFASCKGARRGLRLRSWWLDALDFIISWSVALPIQTVQTDEITRCILLHIPVNYTDYKDLTTTRLEWWLNMVK